MPHLLPARPPRWRTSPHTSLGRQPTRSRPRVRPPRKARGRAPAGSSAVGSANSSRMRFASLSWRISGCETRSAGPCSTADGQDDMEFREITEGDIPDLFAVRVATHENAYSREELLAL